MNQLIVILDGPDGCGKTEIAKELARIFGKTYFKMSAERDNWTKGKFLEELRFGERRQVELFKQLGMSAVIDRGHPSEWVYSQVFGRETDMGFLREVDQEYARMGTTIIVPWREDYSKNRDDDLVPCERLQLIHDTYEEFVCWTNCRVVTINVDYYMNDLSSEVGYLLHFLPWAWQPAELKEEHRRMR
jgi:energy-coupling factor transporter ATP-binding protein EcfA2